MNVELNVQPLDGGFAGVPTYLRNLIAALETRHPSVALHFAADHVVEELPRDRQTLVSPPIRDLKGKLLWENLRYPLHTLASRPDIVHIPYHATTCWGGGRRVITIHDCFLWDHPPTARGERVDLWLLGQAARRAHLIITDSLFSANMIERLFRIDRDRIHVTPLACAPDIVVERPSAEVDVFRARHGIGARSIFYAGGTAAHKNVAALVKAYGLLEPDLRATTNLVIAGRVGNDAPHHLAIHAAIADLAGPGRVILTGLLPQEELGTAYQSASLFAFPSLYEGFGLAPLEAMACSLPVIVSDRASIPEVVGDAGIIVDPLDHTALAAAFTRVLGDPAREQAMRQASRARAATFTWNRTADLTVDAYRAALSR